MKDEYVLVHADGGECHGAEIKEGRCVMCNCAPDMQSTEFWRKSAVVKDNRELMRSRNREVCRVCGSTEVHSQKYGLATIHCTRYLFYKIAQLEERLKKYEQI